MAAHKLRRWRVKLKKRVLQCYMCVFTNHVIPKLGQVEFISRVIGGRRFAIAWAKNESVIWLLKLRRYLLSCLYQPWIGLLLGCSVVRYFIMFPTNKCSRDLPQGSWHHTGPQCAMPGLGWWSWWGQWRCETWVGHGMVFTSDCSSTFMDSHGRPKVIKTAHDKMLKVRMSKLLNSLHHLREDILTSTFFCKSITCCMGNATLILQSEIHVGWCSCEWLLAIPGRRCIVWVQRVCYWVPSCYGPMMPSRQLELMGWIFLESKTRMDVFLGVRCLIVSA